MLENVKNGLRQLTEMGLLLIALGIVLQILFGATVPFIGGNIVGNLTALIGMLGDNGLVGLIALTIILYLFQKPRQG